MNTFGDRETALARIVNSEAAITALRAHVQEIVEGAAFKGSHRSGQFLTYIVDHAIGGHFESLKERVIGIELFGRSPSYDTSEDAIVRVTASDVRKRLLQHYGRGGDISEFRINLPLGSYVPDIIYTPHAEEDRHDAHNASRDAPDAFSTAAASRYDPVQQQMTAPETPSTIPNSGALDTGPPRVIARRIWPWAAVILALNLAIWGIAWKHFVHREASPVTLLPWSVIFSSTHPTHLITSDPDIAGIQLLTGSRLSVSDYANENYLPANNKLSDEVKRICRDLLDGDKAATIDAQIAANIAGVARSASKTIAVQGARGFQFSNLKTDDNFIFLGSPSSDPWFSFFNDQLDFRIVPSQDPGGEMIQNVKPGPNERAFYSPTAKGGATGQSYALVAFIANRDQYGHVLLLAGANSEGTQAAGKLVTDQRRLLTALQECGIQPSGPLRHFEMLLRVTTMAGYPDQFNMEACHLLPSGATH